MIDYTVLNSDQKVIRIGRCDEADLAHQTINPGETVVEGHLPYEGGPTRTNYTHLRRLNYPDVGLQLDAIYKLAIAVKAVGIPLHPDTQTWMDWCASVKNEYPKGTSV